MSLHSAMQEMVDTGLTWEQAAIMIDIMERHGVASGSRDSFGASGIKKSAAAIRQERYRERKKAGQCDAGDVTPVTQERNEIVTDHNETITNCNKYASSDVTRDDDVTQKVSPPSSNGFPPHPLSLTTTPPSKMGKDAPGGELLPGFPEVSGATNLSRPNKKSGIKPTGVEDFDRFWEEYPLKLAKPTALKAWEKAVKKLRTSGVTIADLMLKLRKYNRLWELNGSLDREKVPYPATWLNAERWNDQIDRLLENAERNPSNSTNGRSPGGPTDSLRALHEGLGTPVRRPGG